jgi:predicted MFS family arabinose efflux permease
VVEGSPAAAPVKVGPYRYYVLLALLVVYTLNFLDRQFLTVLQEPVKKTLHLSDTELGSLTGLYFALFYTVIGIPVGMLADRINRVRIVAGASAIWSFFTAACGFATSFLTLAIPRMGVGVGEAGGAPPSYSIVSDYFPPRQRGTALALFSLGVPFGTMFGAASGGYIAAHYGWQTAFKALGVLGLVIAPIFYLSVREPPRGRFEPGSVHTAGNPLAVLALFIRRPMLGMTALGCGVTAFVGYGLLNWTPSVLIRAKGMSLQEVAAYYAIMAGVTGGLGTWLSGVLVDWLGHMRPSAYALVPAGSMLLSLPFMIAAIYAPTWQLSLLFFAGPAMLNNMYLAPALAVVQNAVPPAQRVVSGALLLFVLNLVGLGGGPIFVGMMSDHFKPIYGAAKGLEYGVLSLAPVYILAVLVLCFSAYLISKDAKASK